MCISVPNYNVVDDTNHHLSYIDQAGRRAGGGKVSNCRLKVKNNIEMVHIFTCPLCYRYLTEDEDDGDYDDKLYINTDCNRTIQ